MGKTGYYTGVYEVVNKKKYIGEKDPKYRSSYEARVCYWLDHSDKVLRWGFELINIRYFSPIDNKVHRYFTDFYFEVMDKNDQLQKYLVEVKPYKQTLPPKPPKNKNQKRQKRFLTEAETYIINQSKWKSAQRYCAKRGLNWKIITEKEIFNLK